MARTYCKQDVCTAPARGPCRKCDPQGWQNKINGLKRAWERPEYRAAVSAVLAKFNQDSARQSARRAVRTAKERAAKRNDRTNAPPWVPPHLVDAYLSLTVERGEFVAAAHCRRMKAEAARP